ncbi:hypothetical protein HID58_076515 [Brassica napus]|uniref:Uncharacterized protein n=1 Tax=Brassica napus TaxID=3708 RepID=A0ABQ7YMQ7_BRANA|nr:hypothetical protein HID58_076515 [Brassica napus]
MSIHLLNLILSSYLLYFLPVWTCSDLSLSDASVVLCWYSMPVVEVFWSVLVSLYELGSLSLFSPLSVVVLCHRRFLVAGLLVGLCLHRSFLLSFFIDYFIILLSSFLNLSMFFWCFIYSYMQGLQIFNGSEDCELNLINKSQANHMRYFGQGQQLWQVECLDCKLLKECCSSRCEIEVFSQTFRVVAHEYVEPNVVLERGLESFLDKDKVVASMRLSLLMNMGLWFAFAMLRFIVACFSHYGA